MNVDTAILRRTAVRTFDSAYAMPMSEKQRLLTLAQRAPSAWNIQHWRFVLIEDPEQRRALQTAAANQAQFTDCAMLVAIIVDLHAWMRNPARYFSAMPDDVADVLAEKVLGFYQDRAWLARDDAMRSCGLTAQTLMLAATAANLVSCPMDIFEEDLVRGLLNLPDGLETAMFIAIGKAKPEGDLPRMDRLPYDEVVVVDRFPSP